jgi:hypothetical protein
MAWQCLFGIQFREFGGSILVLMVTLVCALQVTCAADGSRWSLRPDAPSVPVVDLRVPSGSTIGLAVRVVAPGCLPGPAVDVAITVDAVVPSARVDAASGYTRGGAGGGGGGGGGGVLVLFGRARIALSSPVDVSSSVLVVTLSTASHDARHVIRHELPLGAAGAWVGDLPCDPAWTRLDATVEAPGCVAAAAPAAAGAAVTVVSAPEYLVRLAEVPHAVADKLVRAGYMTIWALLLLTQPAASAAKLYVGEWLVLSKVIKEVAKAPRPMLPPPLQGDPSPARSFVVGALRGLSHDAIAPVVRYFESRGLNTATALESLADEARASEAAADVLLSEEGIILPGYRATLIDAMRAPAHVPPSPHAARDALPAFLAVRYDLKEWLSARAVARAVSQTGQDVAIKMTANAWAWKHEKEMLLVRGVQLDLRAYLLFPHGRFSEVWCLRVMVSGFWFSWVLLFVFLAGRVLLQ